MAEIQIKYETKKLISKISLIKSIVRQHLAKRGIENAELSIVITTDKKIKVLNRKYRNINKPTDVLSFPQRDCPSFGRTGVSPVRKKGTVPIILLGDIVISAETLKKQAKIYNNNSVDAELKLLVTHGIEHLLGHHHKE